MGLMKFMNQWKFKQPNQYATTNQSKASSDRPLRPSLQDNLAKFRQALHDSPDIVIRELDFGESHSTPAALLYVSGLVDQDYVNQFIIAPLLSAAKAPEARIIDIFNQHVMPIGGIHEADDFDALLTGLLSGETVFLCEGYNRGLLIGSKGGESRGIEEPTSQSVIRGPKDGFTESLMTNVSLIRRRIASPDLWSEQYRIGHVTKTKVAIFYLHGKASMQLIEEVRARLARIDIDGILESGYIEEWIQDNPHSVFPTVFNSERPDVITAGLLEGRVAIVVDGTPFVLLVPALFTHFFQAAEDYYQRYDVSTLIRWLRYFGFGIALLGPSLYIAITTYHHDMLPPQLLISLSAQREGIPFPAFIEALMMELTFELLREAGIRLPRAVGQSISIVGALVIGQAAVQAGIVSAAMVIVVSITAIASFTMPSYNFGISIRILRFLMMGLAACLGLFGIVAGVIMLIQHLCNLRSFGTPYMSPFSPVQPSKYKDTLIRAPWQLMRRQQGAIHNDGSIDNRSDLTEAGERE
ncbi:spore germination protein KA [Paenibacillus sp. CCS19]|uniref:spore germination protein n=1 Tax=Paenibacillus sp. CCS19 TaxID=3158387 RepID=UPI0025661802|nr:spore germination protein [Paenibacillus cellulosilyticus]GMK40387.1 spore germination protein KA [Paenibacillus cellulosilyticus]